MKRVFFLAVAVVCATVIAYASTLKYEDIVRCRAANGAIYGVRSMADGEHFTIIKGKKVVRCSYADRADSLVMFEGDFRIGSYASPKIFSHTAFTPPLAFTAASSSE